MRPWRGILTLVIFTFVVSILLNLGSSSLIKVLPLVLSFGFLFFIVCVGIVFDILGVAAAAGRESPFHAMAANRIAGARECIWMVRNADKVASFSSDVIGDIAGTLSGAIGAGIVFRLVLSRPSLNETLLNLFIIALVAALTVGGKAWGKTIAISRSTDILYIAGRVLHVFPGRTKILELGQKNRNGSGNDNRQNRRRKG